MKEGTKVITVRLQEADKLRIEMAAYKENRSVNNFIVNVVKQYIDEQENSKAKKIGDS